MTGREALGARVARFEAVWVDHHPRVLGYALRRTPGTDDAADIVADTFLVAWRRLDDAPTSDTHLWLYGIARRVLANQRRGERRRSQLAERLRHDLLTREVQPVAGSEDLAALSFAFRSLSDSDRELLALDAWEQLQVGEIATVLGCSRNAAAIRLHRARRRLRRALERQEAKPDARPPRRSADSAITKGEPA